MVTPATVKRRAAQRERLSGLGIDLHEKPKGRNKFHNVPATFRGERYDSAGEAEYAQKLELMRVAGEIADWERPKPIILLDAPKAGDRISYRPDFYVIRNAPTEFAALKPMPTGYYVDYKGSRATETPLWRVKVKLWRQKIPHELRVVYPDGSEKIVATGNEAIQERPHG